MRKPGKLLVCLVALLVCGAHASSANAAVPQARLLPDGPAVAPPSAPPAVKSMIEAANRVRHPLGPFKATPLA